MNAKTMVKLVLAGIYCLGLGTAYAAVSETDSADVWAVVEEVWNSDEKGDKKWPDKLLAAEFVGWGKNSPAPRGKESTKMWDRFSDQMGKTVAHELYPLSIVVHEDVAVAHYLYTAAFQDKEGKIETSNGRYTDILVRTDTGWKFLAWHGGQDD